MATSVRCSAGQKGHRAYGGIPGEEKVFMKFFRPDQDQVSSFRIQEISKCQVCLGECGTQRIIAQPGCCKCLVHLDCFNDLAAHPNSASTFTCPKCDRELSGESIRAARRRTYLATSNENGGEEGNEMILGSMATKNITARGMAHRGQVCGDGVTDRHRQEVSISSSQSSESRDSTHDAAPLSQAVPEEVSRLPRVHNRRGSPALAFFTPYQEMERRLAAEQNKASRSGDFLSWLLTMIAGRSPKQNAPQKQSQDYQTPNVYSQFLTTISGQREKQTICGS